MENNVTFLTPNAGMLPMPDSLKPWYLLGLSTFLALPGCTNQPTYIPVVDKSYPRHITHGQHVVKKGETLHAIAWRYGRDARELSSINGIKTPYIIYPGQKINLTRPKDKQVARTTTNKKKTSKTKKYSYAKQQTENYIGGKSTGWMLPAAGKIVNNYANKFSENKGIDIIGPYGAPVKATATGKVVYSGSGLRGYGQLIIIKHNGEFLSAYAHNSKLLVNEGDIVKVGQKIAEMGRSGAKKTKLHFEIRRNGKPVNPLMYLAKR